MTCKNCGKSIDSYDVGAYRKFADREAREYACRDCLAEQMGWSREYLDELISFYRKRNCMLFPPLGDENDKI